MTTLPKNSESFLKSFVKQTYCQKIKKISSSSRGFTEKDYRLFSKGIAKLNRFFTAERSDRPKNYFNQKELRSAYLLYFLPINALKIAGLLKEISQTFFKRKLNILDLGSGPATGAIGALWHGAQIDSITLVDQNRHILRDGASLIDRLRDGWREEVLLAGPTCPDKTLPKRQDPSKLVQSIVSDITDRSLIQKLPKKKFNLIIVSNVLNEISNPKQRFHLIRSLFQKTLAPDGFILIVEPALRQQTRELMQLHDELIKQKIGYIHAPCLHQEFCPMLATNRRDWCHTYLEWERPEWIERFDRLVGIRKDYLKASYLIVGNTERGAGGGKYRVVSGPLNSKGKMERLLCGQGKLKRVVCLDRDQSKQSKILRKAKRGDIIAQ